MTTKPHTPVKSPDTVSNELKRLLDTSGMTLRKAAQIEPYRGIPHSTLKYIADGHVPKKWHKQLGISIVDISVPLKERKKKTPAWVTRGADFLQERERPGRFTRQGKRLG